MNCFEKRKIEREKKWSSILIKKNNDIIFSEAIEKSERSVEKNLELLCQLRLMSYPQLSNAYKMDKTIIKFNKAIVHDEIQ